MTPGAKVLVIEDEAPMRRFLRVALAASGYRCLEAGTGGQGIAEAEARSPDVVLLDLGLPDLDGLEVTRRLRAVSRAPIVVLSARGQERDKVDALDAGADDYLTKPFGVAELLARIRVALRHRELQGAPAAGEVVRFGAVGVDLAARRVTLENELLHLTPTEFRLLSILVRHAGRVVTHRQLLHEAWGPAFGGQTQYLRVYVGQLRHKLEADPARPRHLLTEPGVGYRLEVD